MPRPPEVEGAKHSPRSKGSPSTSFPNGLKVLLFPDASKPTVTVNMTVLVGSRHEGYGEAGMAHLLEHMLFKGTPQFPGPEGDSDAPCTSAGPSINASTDVDRTNFHETLPATDANLEFAIRLEADRLMNSFMHAADFKSEMTVVRNEFETGENSPEGILMQRMVSAAYEWHNYGKSTIGNKSDIERVPIEKLQEFYHRHYQPENTLLVVAGKFQPKTVLELRSSSISARFRGSEFGCPTTTYTEEPPQDGERIVRLTPRREAWPSLGRPITFRRAADPEFPAVEVLDGILSDEPSGRLYKSLVETKKAATVYGRRVAARSGRDDFMARVVRRERIPKRSSKTMEATIANVAKNGVTQEEVDRIRQQILKQREMDAANSARHREWN